MGHVFREAKLAEGIESDDAGFQFRGQALRRGRGFRKARADAIDVNVISSNLLAMALEKAMTAALAPE